ncbi:MAG: DUF4214 domain-containing protein, partial [Pirellulales bacterium]
YTEKATRQVVVTIHDRGGSTATTTSTADVADAPLSPGAALTLHATAGMLFSGTLGTFTDGDPKAPLADFTATIDWGDGSTSAGAISAAPGEFILSAGHTYASPAAEYPVKVIVNDIDGSQCTVLASAHVASTRFTASGSTITSIEGATFSGAVATCNDIDPNPAHYAATIDWGDGTTTAGTIAPAFGGGFVVNGGHVFAAANTAQMTIIISNPSLDQLTVSSQANVGDAPLTPSGITFTATEGTLFKGEVAAFSDAGGGNVGDFTATIAWGDGSTSAGAVTNTGSGFAVLGSHTYPEETQGLTVRVSISDVGGAKATPVSSANVADAPLIADPTTLNVPPGGTVDALTLMTFIDQGGSGSPGDYTAAINWGDSTSLSGGSVAASGTGLQVAGSHQYLLPGTYTIQILVHDKGGSTATADVQAIVPPSANQLYVEAAYKDVLARVVDNPALIDWSGQLNAGQPRAALASALDHSAEYYANIIVAPAYQRYLDRVPDAAGLAYWVDQLQNQGLTDERLEAGFIGSPEFFAHAGGTNKAWIDTMYQDLLGRSADAAGENYWLGQLTAGVSRAQVAYDFTAGPERESLRIADDYMHYLGRLPDQQGLDYWLNQFASGLTNEDLITGFVASDEYYQKHTD